MQKYRYTALNDKKTLVEGEIEAENIKDARIKIRTLSLLPTSVSLINQTGIGTELNTVHQPDFVNNDQNIDLNRYILKLNLTQKISFTRELRTMLSAGIPVLDSLYSIEKTFLDTKLKNLARNLKTAIEKGYNFSESLSYMYGKTFGNVYTALVKTGEASGKLEITLERLQNLLTKQNEIKGKIINASIYPSICLTIAFGVLILFAKFVFPAFMGIIKCDCKLPLFARSVMDIMTFIGNYWWLVILCMGCAGYFIMSFFRKTVLKDYLDSIVLKIPVLSEFAELVNLSNFMAVMHVTYEAGIPLNEGVELANHTVNNVIMKKDFDIISKLLHKGYSFTDAISMINVFPPYLTGLIATGEKSGTLGKSFSDATEFIDARIDAVLGVLTKMFEPFMMIFIGIIVLVIALAFVQIYTAALGSLI